MTTRSSHCTRAGEEHLRRIRERMREMVESVARFSRVAREAGVTAEEFGEMFSRIRRAAPIRDSSTGRAPAFGAGGCGFDSRSRCQPK